MFCETLGYHRTLLKNTELDYISSHTRKSILTSTNPTTHLLDLRINVFQTQQCAFTRRYNSTYKSLELTTATRLLTVIKHTLTKFCNAI